MGQKVNPIGFRLGIVRDWDSRWYARKGTYQEWVLEDHKVRKLIRERFSGETMRAAAGRGGGGRGGGGGGGRGGRGGVREVGISKIEIERAPNLLKLSLHTAKPGLIIGRGGRGVEDVRADIERLVKRKVHINVLEIRQPELDAYLVAENIASQVERRIAFKRAVRQGIQRTMKAGAKGIRVVMGGRLGGAEMSRQYSDRDGKIPLQTLRADIDYGFVEAKTPSGNIGVKVWVYRGDILPEMRNLEQPRREAVPLPTTTPTGERPRKGWRRVGPARQEGEGEVVATSETPAEPGAAEERAPGAPEVVEERDSHVDAVEGQVS
jgi:small subunit ribosomal protein S3